MLLARRVGNDFSGWKLENCPLTPSCPSDLVNYATYLYTSTLRSPDEQDLQHAILQPRTIMKKLVRLNYLYRDGGNYKSWGSVDFENPDGLKLDEIQKRQEKCFDMGCLFNAKQAGIPEIFLFEDEDSVNTDDHCFHEYSSVEALDASSVDIELQSRTIGAFVEDIEKCSQNGWKAFDPLDYLSEI